MTDSNMSPVSVGIVGTGVGIRTHLAGFTVLPGADVVGVVGSTVERARGHLIEAGHSVELACDFDRLLELRPRLVCLTTPPLGRVEYAEALAELGAALLIEKPVGVSYDTAASDLASLLRAPSTFTNFQLRGLPAFATIRRRVEAGEFGTIYSLRAEEKTAAFRRATIAPWQERRSTGGGQRLAMGPHLLDLALFLLGADYADVLWDRASAGRGSCATPRGSWVTSRLADARSHDLADETFRASFQAADSWINLFTTSIGVGSRTLKVELDGTEGLVRFDFVDGVGQVEVVTNGGHEKYTLSANGALSQDANLAALNPSLFRVAFPAFATSVLEHVTDGRCAVSLASLADGLANLAVLDRLVATDGVLELIE